MKKTASVAKKAPAGKSETPPKATSKPPAGKKTAPRSEDSSDRRASTSAARAAAATAPALAGPAPPTASEQAGMYDRAMSLFHAREYTKAKGLFETAANGPNREMAHAARLHVRMCDHRIARAVPELHTPEDRYNYAVALINRRELDPAEEQLRLALREAENVDYLHYALALCLGLKGDLDGACRHLGRAIELQPGNRVIARNDPDFHEIAQSKPLRDLLHA